MKNIACPYCRESLLVNIPPDAPTAAEVPLLCASCQQSFLYTVGRGVPLFLAKVRLWLPTSGLVSLALFIGCIYAAVLLYRAAGASPLLAALGLVVALGLCRRDALADVNALLMVVVGTATLTALAAGYFWHVHALRDQLPMMAVAVLAVLAVAYFGAPAAEWTPPLPPNTQHGSTQILTSVQDLERALRES